MRADAKLRMCTLGAFFLVGAAAVSSPSALGSPPPGIDSEFRTNYPLTAPSAPTPVAGIELAKLVIPGLQVAARSEQAPEDGGLILSFADDEGVVRVLVQLAVLADAAAARKIMDAALHGVATQLVKAGESTLGDLAWADDAGKGTALVIATQANVAYSVAVVGAAPSVPGAAAIAALVRKSMVAGRPTFPAATIKLAATIDTKSGGAVRITVPDGCSYKVHADGGYMTRGPGAAIVRPFAPGLVTVYATVVDTLARVTVTAGTTTAK